jgi:uncharacterized protein (TIGR03435 family)
MAVLLAIRWVGLPGLDQSNAQVQTPPAAPLVFGVASIKPSDPSRPLPFRIGPKSLTTYGSLKVLIMQAYEIRDYQVAGGLAWAQSERYDVQAKADTASSPHQIRVMLQALLADRFRLTLHRETRTVAGYVLSVDKGGAKLPPAKSEMPPDSPGVTQMGGGVIWARGATLDNLAEALWIELGLPVVDETKIEGNYNFTLRFEEGNNELAEKPDGASETAELQTTDSIFMALHKVGLRLDSRTVPVQVFVIDSAERPSEN